MTDLFAAAAHLDERVLADATPPAVRRDLAVYEAPRRDGDDLVLELGPWTPRAPVRHLVPSLALLTARPYGVRFEVSGQRAGRWSSWVGTAVVGEAVPEPIAGTGDGLQTDIDEIRAAPPLEAVRLRVRVAGEGRTALLDAPWLVTLSAWDGALDGAGAPLTPVRLAVPPRSQLVEPEAVRLRICSPTSVAMSMEFLGRAVPTMTVAAEVYHAATDRYGLWPAAVRAAAAHGLAGYVLRFPGWEAAAWCLARGLPIVASIRYAAGELTDSAIPETTGHLVVITGLAGDDVLVNDPAAPPATVCRRYDRDEFTRAWLQRTGIGYVFFRPG